MKILLLLFSALAFTCGQALAQQPAAPAANGQQGNGRPPCTASHDAPAATGCAMPADPGKMMADEPTAAGPRTAMPTRQQVVAEIDRARRAGEMDFAAAEVSLDSPRHR